uniref:NADH-ubiquinone oxidoreductase chain 4 n=1 Tax=Euphaedusa planostriata TaxID=2798995 RepID=A0A7T7IEY0_9EUPU|nr:NADH dehydrogenase subunit 4 [Euphaedusa planostriata]QQL04607.1 NADH dehydrogenase subunit 4 [Euphaedusa planostriata]
MGLLMMLILNFMYPYWSSLIVVMNILLFTSFFYMYKSFTITLSSTTMSMGNSLNNFLIMLSVFLVLLVFLSTPSMKSALYLSTVQILLLSLLLVFFSGGLLTFYFFFEFSLLPTLFLILSYGYQPERLLAGVYMMLYTVSASLPLLLLILYIQSEFSSASLLLLMLSNLSCLSMSFMFFLFFSLAFFVKLPLYSLHLWLPKAHVEAPLGGSMLLAGILLKLGGYGLYLSMGIYSFPAHFPFSSFLISLSTWGGIMASVVCLQQVDVKAFVAYSSIVHMAFVSVGLLSGKEWGLICAKITMIAHGFTSSALFVLANLVYSVSNSRSMLISSGLLSTMPSFAIISFFLLCMNMSAPPSINLVGELCLIPSILETSFFILLAMGLIMFISVGYNMFLYSSLNSGPLSKIMSSHYLLGSYNLMSLMLHTALLLFLFSMFFLMELVVNYMT